MEEVWEQRSKIGTLQKLLAGSVRQLRNPWLKTMPGEVLACLWGGCREKRDSSWQVLWCHVPVTSRGHWHSHHWGRGWLRAAAAHMVTVAIRGRKMLKPSFRECDWSQELWCDRRSRSCSPGKGLLLSVLKKEQRTGVQLLSISCKHATIWHWKFNFELVYTPVTQSHINSSLLIQLNNLRIPGNPVCKISLPHKIKVICSTTEFKHASVTGND